MMWNMYGSNGNGVAIGCKKSKLISTISESSNWARCIYDKQVFKVFLDDYFHKIYNNIEIKGTLHKINLGFPLKELPFDFGRFKSSFFEHEKEWRFMKQLDSQSEQIKFHHSNGVLKPFIENKFLKSDLKKIVIGPCADKELSKRSIEMLLQNAGFSTNEKCENFVEVIISPAPYRII